MKNLRQPLFILSVILFLASGLRAQTILYSEGFETNGEGSRYTSNAYLIASPTCDFFEREAISPLNTCFGGTTFTGFRGSFFWASEDIMSSPGNRPPGSIQSNSFSISSYNNLKVSLYLATSNNNGTRWETADSINVKVSINGGAFITVGRFMGNATLGGSLIVDANLNGVADPAETTVASVVNFTKYTFNIPGTGSNMRVLLDFDQLGGSEELGVDDLEVTGISTLPVKLLYFQAEKTTAGEAKLNWKTADPSDAAWFETEKSMDGISFTTLQRIPAAINTNTYSDTDPLPGNHTVYYRLKMTDQQGMVNYSQVVAFRNQPGQGIRMQPVHPIMPAQEPVVIINTNSNVNGQLTAWDMNGRLLATRKLVLPAGETATSLPLRNLVTGVYMLRLTDEYGRLLADAKLLVQ